MLQIIHITNVSMLQTPINILNAWSYFSKKKKSIGYKNNKVW